MNEELQFLGHDREHIEEEMMQMKREQIALEECAEAIFDATNKTKYAKYFWFEDVQKFIAALNDSANTLEQRRFKLERKFKDSPGVLS